MRLNNLWKNLLRDGNILPRSWFKKIRLTNGQPDFSAILILSDIITYYRPSLENEKNLKRRGKQAQIIQMDLLQKSYESYTELLGLSKEQVIAAMDRLEQNNLIKRHSKIAKTLTDQIYAPLLIELNITSLRRTLNKKSKDIYEEKDRFTLVQNQKNLFTEQNILSLNMLKKKSVSIAQQMINIWNKELDPINTVSLTSMRQKKLCRILYRYFNDNIEAWRSFCHHLQQRSWLPDRITLDRILKPENLPLLRQGHSISTLKNIEKNKSVSPEVLLLKAYYHIHSLKTCEAQEFAAALLNAVGVSIYMSWFQEITLQIVQPETAYIICPTPFFRDYIQKRFSHIILNVIKHLYPATNYHKWILQNSSEKQKIFNEDQYPRELSPKTQRDNISSEFFNSKFLLKKGLYHGL